MSRYKTPIEPTKPLSIDQYKVPEKKIKARKYIDITVDRTLQELLDVLPNDISYSNVHFYTTKSVVGKEGYDGNYDEDYYYETSVYYNVEEDNPYYEKEIEKYEKYKEDYGDLMKMYSLKLEQYQEDLSKYNEWIEQLKEADLKVKEAINKRNQVNSKGY